MRSQGFLNKLVVVLALCGGGLLAYSLSVLPYKDEQAFMQQYSALRAGQSQEFLALRDAQLTAKYTFQDFGIQLLISAALLALLTSRGHIRVNAIHSRAVAASAAVVLPVLSVGGYVFDLLQAFGRGEFPHWADSMGIPLMGVPFLLVSLCLWAFVNLAFMSGTFQSGISLGTACRWRRNWWLLINAGLWLSVAAVAALSGQYWYAVPSVAWVYFFLSIAASRLNSDPSAER